MTDNKLTAAEAKKARTALALSQMKVSQAIGMHRTKYALFEVNRYIFTEEEQTKLKKYFESQGYTFPERPQPKKPPPPPYRVMQGVAVPNRINSEGAKQLLAQIAQNDEYIRIKAKERAGQNWLTDEPKIKEARKLITLMAYNYCHLRQLMGLNSLLGDEYARDMDPEDITNGALVNERLYS